MAKVKSKLMAYVGNDEVIVFLPEKKKVVEREFFNYAGRDLEEYDLEECFNGYVSLKSKVYLQWY